MRAGPMRQRLTLQRLTESSDAYGQRTQAWEDVITVAARVVNTAGAEVVNARQVKAEITHVVHTRYLGSILPAGQMPPGWRLIYRGRVLHILWCEDINERHRELALTCQEIYGTPA